MNLAEMHGTILEYIQGLYPEGTVVPEMDGVSICISFMGLDELQEGEEERRVLGGVITLDPNLPDETTEEDLVNGGTIPQLATAIIAGQMKSIQAACTKHAIQARAAAQEQQS